jgi:hypothetical protein
MEDNEHESGLMKDNVLFFSKDNIDNSSYLAYGLERLLPLRQHCSAAGLSGKEYLNQQYKQ